MPRELTERDREVLVDLDVACRNYQHEIGQDWVQPLDCGGSNGSDHSYRLSKLAKMGLAEQKRRGGWSRGSKKYRITPAGRATLFTIGHTSRPREFLAKIKEHQDAARAALAARTSDGEEAQ